MTRTFEVSASPGRSMKEFGSFRQNPIHLSRKLLKITDVQRPQAFFSNQVPICQWTSMDFAAVNF
jgi:hypothetical protein